MEIKKNENLGVAATPKPNNILDRYISLSKAKKVREIEPNGLDKICTDVITLAFIQSGNNAAHPDDEKILRQLLYNDLKNDFPGITGEEVAEAFRLGSKGEYGKVFGINSAAWNDWLRGFLKDPSRLLALKNIKEKPTEPSDEEKRNHIISGFNLINSMYLNFCAGVKKPDLMKTSLDIITQHPSIGFAFGVLVKNEIMKPGFDEELVRRAGIFLMELQDEKVNPADRIKRINATTKQITKEWESELNTACKMLRLIEAFTAMHKQNYDLLKILISKI